jgi:hypothetical protein
VGTRGIGEVERRGWRGEHVKALICMYENRIMKSISNCLKKGGWGGRIRKSNRGGDFDHSPLYASMEIS